MSTNKVRGVVIPRHDTAINWAKAVNFVPSDGELIVFTPDIIPTESTAEGPIWTIYDGNTLTDVVYNNSTDFCYWISSACNTANLTLSSNIEGCYVNNVPTRYKNKDGNGNLVDATTSFELKPSGTVRFKFGDGKTNVNLLPYVTTGLSGIQGAPGNTGGSGNIDLTGIATQDWVREYINNYDSVSLMEVTKSGASYLELKDVYPIQNNADLRLTKLVNPLGCPIKIYNHNLIDDNTLKSWKYNIDTIAADKLTIGNEFSNDVTGFGDVSVNLEDGYVSASLTPNNQILTATHNDIYFYFTNSVFCSFDGTKLHSNQTYTFMYYFDTEQVDSTTYRIIPKDAFLVQDGPYAEYDVVLVEANSDGTLDASKLFYPYSLITYQGWKVVPLGDYGYQATYDTEYKVDQHYNPTSPIPQSGTAVAEALEDLLTILPGSSIEDIPSTVTSKIVILYKE